MRRSARIAELRERKAKRPHPLDGRRARRAFLGGAPPPSGGAPPPSPPPPIVLEEDRIIAPDEYECYSLSSGGAPPPSNPPATEPAPPTAVRAPEPAEPAEPAEALSSGSESESDSDGMFRAIMLGDPNPRPALQQTAVEISPPPDPDAHTRDPAGLDPAFAAVLYSAGVSPYAITRAPVVPPRPLLRAADPPASPLPDARGGGEAPGNEAPCWCRERGAKPRAYYEEAEACFKDGVRAVRRAEEALERADYQTHPVDTFARTFYELAGVDRNAPPHIVAAAFRNILLVSSPDSYLRRFPHMHQDTERWRIINRVFDCIQYARSILVTPPRRFQYDRLLERAACAPHGCLNLDRAAMETALDLERPIYHPAPEFVALDRRFRPWR